MVMYKIDRRGGGEGRGGEVQKSFSRTDPKFEILKVYAFNLHRYGDLKI